MDEVDTVHVGRYWTEVLCCNIKTHRHCFRDGSPTEFETIGHAYFFSLDIYSTISECLKCMLSAETSGNASSERVYRMQLKNWVQRNPCDMYLG